MNESPHAVAQACRVVHVWLHRDMVQCVINRLVSCLFSVFGGAGRYHKGRISAVAAPDTLADSWAPVQKESRTVRPSLIAFLGSRRQWLCQATRAPPALFLELPSRMESRASHSRNNHTGCSTTMLAARPHPGIKRSKHPGCSDSSPKSRKKRKYLHVHSVTWDSDWINNPQHWKCCSSSITSWMRS